jgi:hypothetical protein
MVASEITNNMNTPPTPKFTIFVILQEEKAQDVWRCSGCNATFQSVEEPTHCLRCERKVFRLERRPGKAA